MVKDFLCFKLTCQGHMKREATTIAKHVSESKLLVCFFLSLSLSLPFTHTHSLSLSFSHLSLYLSFYLSLSLSFTLLSLASGEYNIFVFCNFKINNVILYIKVKVSLSVCRERSCSPLYRHGQ